MSSPRSREAEYPSIITSSYFSVPKPSLLQCLKTDSVKALVSHYHHHCARNHLLHVHLTPTVAAKLAHGLPTTLRTKPAWSYLRLRNRIIWLCTTVNIRQRRRLPSFHSSTIACISSIRGVVDINNGRDVARASALNAVYDEGDPE